LADLNIPLLDASQRRKSSIDSIDDMIAKTVAMSTLRKNKFAVVVNSARIVAASSTSSGVRSGAGVGVRSLGERGNVFIVFCGSDCSLCSLNRPLH
jgi:hypothetical protein